jgi:hypothetical protein
VGTAQPKHNKKETNKETNHAKGNIHQNQWQQSGGASRKKPNIQSLTPVALGKIACLLGVAILSSSPHAGHSQIHAASWFLSLRLVPTLLRFKLCI